MKTSLFDFTLPESLIASAPANPRDSARLLVVGDNLHDQYIPDLITHLRCGDVMVFNDTKVIPARLFGKRGDAKIEILLHKQKKLSPHAGQTSWLCFAKPAKKLKQGDRIDIGENFYGVVTDKTTDGQVLLEFNCAGEAFFERLNQHGHMPLPPYIERADESSDKQSYQTIYAAHVGSVAAPTAGLHFTERLLVAIDAAGVKRVHITLHVGGGTFLPVKTDDTNEHVMHSEYAIVTAEAAGTINAAKKSGGRVIAVGTTSLRTLESATDSHGVIHPFAQETAIFITPGYQFKIVDMLLTNFHLPKSTLFMLVSAFSGLERMQAAYQHAIAQKYRFYSYGDASLLYKKT